MAHASGSTQPEQPRWTALRAAPGDPAHVLLLKLKGLELVKQVGYKTLLDLAATPTCHDCYPCWSLSQRQSFPPQHPPPFLRHTATDLANQAALCTML